MQSKCEEMIRSTQEGNQALDEFMKEYKSWGKLWNEIHKTGDEVLQAVVSGAALNIGDGDFAAVLYVQGQFYFLETENVADENWSDDFDEEKKRAAVIIDLDSKVTIKVNKCNVKSMGKDEAAALFLSTDMPSTGGRPGGLYRDIKFLPSREAVAARSEGPSELGLILG